MSDQETMPPAQRDTIQAWVSTEAKLTPKGVDITAKSTVGMTTDMNNPAFNDLTHYKLIADTVALISSVTTRTLLGDLVSDTPTNAVQEATDTYLKLINIHAQHLLGRLLTPAPEATADPEFVIAEPVEDVDGAI